MIKQSGKWIPSYADLYFISLGLLVGSLPLSKFTTSIFEFGTLFFWLWHGVDTGFLQKYRKQSLLNPLTLLRFAGDAIRNIFIALIRKFREFFRNKPAMVLASLFLLHLLGLLYTTDFGYALKDLRTKLPILILPLFLATGPRISTRTFYLIMGCLIAAVLGGSIYRLILYFNLPVADKRALSAHTSHIRFCLNAVLALFAIFFLLSRRIVTNRFLVAALMVTVLWMAGFMLYMNYTTGILLLLFLAFLSAVYYTLHLNDKRKRVLLTTGILAVVLIPLAWLLATGLRMLQTPAVEFTSLEKYTPRGNSYYHDTVNFRMRDGKWTGLYICDKELRAAWAKRSSAPLDSLDPKRQVRRFTLISYLASRDFRKDEEGVMRLSDAEIRNIEKGVNRAESEEFTGIRSQMEDFMTSYQRYLHQNDPNSGSMVQRFEYWKASLQIIRQHPLFGVGTGDLPAAFEEQYHKMNSGLSSQNRLRSHNQYLSVTVAFGLLGLIWFLFVLVYPGVKTGGFRNYFYLIFWIILMASMLTEDTVESQEGVTFFILYASLMLFAREKTEPREELFRQETLGI
jgi:hypothetical protein